jgi:Cu(I)/Ag(I) efflux system membrane fusion protein
MKKALLWLLVFAAVIAGWVFGYGYGRWYGPRPGRAHVEANGIPKPSGYHCPMHPNFRSDKPGTCGICGMRLVPDDEPPSAGAMKTAEPPAGAIHVSPEKQQLLGVRFGTAEFTTSVSSFRANGKVTIDETRISKVQSKVEGWIERVFADFMGKTVEKGEPMLTLYSPEMLATQQELLLALKSRDLLKRGPLPGGVDQGESLVAAARRRLELWDLDPEQIASIERTGQPIRTITIQAPIRGHITMRNAFPKQRVTPETELYTIADLSRVWIMADVFESDAAAVREGTPATLTLTYAGGRQFRARVAFIEPHLDAMTRTLRVRLEADNPSMTLKPEMFVDVEFHGGGARRLTVAAEAVLDTGLRQTVFIDRGNGFLEPRSVRVGERMGDRIEILAGLQAGERVVTSGGFLLDSETQLRQGPAAAPASPESPRPQQPPPGAHKHD